MKRLDKFLDRLVYLTLIALGAGMIFYSAHYAALVVRSERWAESSGKILYSFVVAGGKSVHPRYTPKVVYQYSVDGVSYTGSTLSHEFSWNFLGTDEETAGAKLNDFPKVAEVKVYYDPEAPAYSCLVKGGNAAGYVYPFALGVIFGSFGVWGIRRKLTKRTRRVQ